MKILIIGSTGFIGTNAVSYFKLQGNEVFCADINDKKENNYFFLNPINPDFNNLFINQQFDVCINASGAANVQFSFTNTALDYQLNVSNVFLMLEAIKLYNPECKFINFSSAAVYGNSDLLPISEKTELKPLSPYGWHKLYSEQICREFYDYFSIPTISLRIFSAYGPGLKKQIFWDLYQKSLNSKIVEVFGTGNESRDFIYIDDILQIIELLINHKKFDGSAINVANGQEIIIQDILKIFFSSLDWDGSYFFNSTDQPGYPKNWKADINEILKLCYVQKFSMEDGLKITLDWLKANNE